MESEIKLSETAQKLLICPICKAKVEFHGKQYQCKNCLFLFPIVNGIPILIDENDSIFSIDDFVNQRSTTFYIVHSKLAQAARRLLPTLNRNIMGRKNYHMLAQLLLSESNTPKVLVIGGSTLGEGMEAIVA